MSSNAIPLSYVIRENELTADYSTMYITLNEKLIGCIQLDGRKYVSDYKIVFSLLNTHLKDSEGETTSRNGQQYWAALRIHFESENYKSSMKATTIANIRASEYLYHSLQCSQYA